MCSSLIISPVIIQDPHPCDGKVWDRRVFCSLSPLVSLRLWPLQVPLRFSSLRWGRMIRGGWSWVGWALIKPQQVRLWLTRFSSAQALFRILAWCGVIQNGSFPLSLAGSQRDFFDIYCENLVELLKVNLMKLWHPLWPFPLEFLTLRVVYMEPPAIHQLLFIPWSSYPGTGFCTGVSILVSRDSLHFPVCLSNLWGCGFPCVFPFSVDSRSVVGFSVCWAFYLLGWSGDFQVH